VVERNPVIIYANLRLNSALTHTDSTGNLRGVWDYDPYGRVSNNLVTSNAVDSDFKFTGHFYHEKSKLHLTLYRAYDADTGRWISRDPIAEAGGINLYGYVSNNPVNWVDQWGLEVRLESHSVIPSKDHAKITIIPKNQLKWSKHSEFYNKTKDGKAYATIGAGPEDGGKLVSHLNRKTDLKRDKNTYSETIECPKNMTEDQFISSLLKSDRNYSDNLDYDLLPAESGGDQSWYLPDDSYNSNSYVSGLLNATGAKRPSAQPSKNPGWYKPVPSSNFK